MAELGLRYLSINISDKLGHPLRNPWQTALRRVGILGLQWDWCANLTALAQVCMECVKVAQMTLVCVSLVSIERYGAQLLQGTGCGRTVWVLGQYIPLLGLVGSTRRYWGP